MPEDIFLRNVGYNKLSVVILEGGSYPALINSSSSSNESSGTGEQDGNGERSSIKISVVFIPEGFEPGQKVKVNYPDGSNDRTVIPPRSRWSFKNCDGDPRPFFITHKHSNNSSIHKTSAKQDQHQQYSTSSTSRKKVRSINPMDNSLDVACCCLPSLGVYDSICPYHGIASHSVVR